MAYTYSPLSPGHIRIFRGRLSEDGKLFGELRDLELPSGPGEECTPSYDALSYTWGDTACSERVYIEDKSLGVLDAVFAFLKRVYTDDQSSQDLWWWIDSICINLDNNAERSSQVAMMGTIFSRAVMTRVWLGEEDDDSDVAMDFLHWMSKEEFARHSRSIVRTNTDAQTAFRGMEWASLNKLFLRPWWTRVWTVQEFVVSAHCPIHCGSKSISRHDFQVAINSIYDLGVHFSSTAQWNRGRMLDRWRAYSSSNILEVGMSLVATLAYLGDHDATDPRDRVYSLAGIVVDFDLVGYPDYTIGLSQLYSRIVINFVRKYQSLDVVCLATVFYEDKHRSERTLPTWVPDWRRKVRPLVVPTMVSQSYRQEWTRDPIGNLRPEFAASSTAVYYAAEQTKPRVSFSPDFQAMTCVGFILSTVDGLMGLQPTHWGNMQFAACPPVLPCETFDSERAAKSELLSGLAGSLEVIMQSVMRCLLLDREDHYLSDFIDDGRYQAEFTRLLHLVVNESGLMDEWRTFREWFRVNRHFPIYNQTLHDLVAQFTEGVEATRDLPDGNDRQSFYSRFHDTVVKMSRRVVILQNGLLGTAPRRACQGDIVCILYGCNVPVVLRSQEGMDSFIFIGECYVDGFMNGEALHCSSFDQPREFQIF